MQVQAHEIVAAFGIDALAKFATADNAVEIAQCREDWKVANSNTVYLRTFNDGDNVWEVIFSFDDMKAYRTDCHVDVTAEYLAQIIDVVNRRVMLRAAFGIN